MTSHINRAQRRAARRRNALRAALGVVATCAKGLVVVEVGES